jgi:hypothetical protein
MSAHHREILALGGMGAKLFNKRVSIFAGLGKKQNSGGVAIDAMDDEGPLSF